MKASLIFQYQLKLALAGKKEEQKKRGGAGKGKARAGTQTWDMTWRRNGRKDKRGVARRVPCGL